MGSVFVDSTIEDAERRTRLYAGDIFIFSPSQGTRALIDLGVPNAGGRICTVRPQDDT